MAGAVATLAPDARTPDPEPSAADTIVLIEALGRRSADSPPVLSSAGAELAVDDLRRDAWAVTAALVRSGVSAGDVVALCLDSDADWIVAALGVDALGAVISGISPVASAAERTRMLDAVAPTVVVVGRVAPEGVPDDAEVLDITTVRSGAGRTTVPAHDRSASRPWAICCTSGTTGAPRAAVFTAGAAAAVCRIDTAGLADGTGFGLLASTQFAHVGFTLKLPWYLQRGCTVHQMGRWQADRALRAVARHRLRTLGVVTPQLALMLRSPLLDEVDLSCLEMVIAGGAPSPPALVLEAIDRLGAAWSTRWSSTESGGVGLAATIPVGAGADHPLLGTIGTPRPGVAARVAHPDGSPTAEGDTGELQVRSDAMMSGYLGEAAASREAFTPDGWLRTGDLAHVDDHGNVVLDGRRSDMWIRGGYNVHPAEVESVLGRHPDVADVAVVPRPDPVMGEVGVAVVVVRDGHPAPELDALRELCAGHLPRHKLPEDVVVLDRLPLTPADKVDRRSLRGLVTQPARDDTACGAP